MSGKFGGAASFRRPPPPRNEDQEDELVARDNVDFYFLDSNNIEYLSLSDKEIPDFITKRIMDGLDLDIKRTNRLLIHERIQQIFDIRRTLKIF